MDRLTPTEEEVMQYIWQLERCTVSQILELFSGRKPPHSTVSSVVRILEKKGFVGHKAYGRTHEYFPLVEKADYSKGYVEKVVGNYFNGSVSNLVSFLVREKKIDPNELKELLDDLNDES